MTAQSGGAPTPRDVAASALHHRAAGTWLGEQLKDLETLEQLCARRGIDLAEVIVAIRPGTAELADLVPSDEPATPGEHPAPTPEPAPPRAPRPPSRTEQLITGLLNRAETALADADGAVRAEEPWIAEHHRSEANALIAAAHVRTLGQLVSATHRRATATADLAAALRLVMGAR